MIPTLYDLAAVFTIMDVASVYSMLDTSGGPVDFWIIWKKKKNDTQYHVLRFALKLKRTHITRAFHTEYKHLGEQFSFTVVSKLLIIH